MWRGEGGRRGEVVRGGGEVRLPYDRERERREQERRQRQQDTKRQVINWPFLDLGGLSVTVN